MIDHVVWGFKCWQRWDSVLELAALEWVSRCVFEPRNFLTYSPNERYRGNVGQMITYLTGDVDVDRILGVRLKLKYACNLRHPLVLEIKFSGIIPKEYEVWLGQQSVHTNRIRLLLLHTSNTTFEHYYVTWRHHGTFDCRWCGTIRNTSVVRMPHAREFWKQTEVSRLKMQSITSATTTLGKTEISYFNTWNVRGWKYVCAVVT